MEQNKCNLNTLDENLESAYTNAEFEELTDYFIAVNSGKKVDDPRPKMSFINDAMEERAKKFASLISTIIDEFNGKIEK